MRSTWFLRAAAALTLVLALAAACEKSKSAEKQAGPAAPPPTVIVTEVLQRTVPIYNEYVGRTVALETVELRARVEGVLDKAPFREGDLVKAGQVLFLIEPAQYQAALQSARAQLAKAEADLGRARDVSVIDRARAVLDQRKADLGKARQDVERYRPLAQEQAIPQQDLDTSLAQEKVAAAGVEAAEAALKDTVLTQRTDIQLGLAAVEAGKAAVTQAELILGYTVIKAPLDGIIGVRKVDPGNLVGRGEATLLATMSSIDPFKVEFNVGELDMLRFNKRPRRPGADGRPDLSFELILADDSVYPHRGRPRTLDRALDTKTGTILVEALFPNPDSQLRAGQFGRVRVSVEEVPSALLVPQLSIQEVQGAKSVLVVSPDDRVALRTVRLGEPFERFVIVQDGVKAGERVIVEGGQKVRPGMQVKPTVQAMPVEPQPGPKPGR